MSHALPTYKKLMRGNTRFLLQWKEKLKLKHVRYDLSSIIKPMKFALLMIGLQFLYTAQS